MPDVKQRQQVKSGCNGWYDGFNLPTVGTISPVNFWSKLKRDDYKESGCHFLQSKLIQCSSNERTTPTCPLADLPVEILGTITKELDREDSLRLGLTCRRMMCFILTVIQDDILSTPAPWAGLPLAVIGSYLSNLPKSFFDGGLAYKSIDRQDISELDVDNGANLVYEPINDQDMLDLGLDDGPMSFHYLPARIYLWATDYKYAPVTEHDTMGGFRAWAAALWALQGNGEPWYRLLKAAVSPRVDSTSIATHAITSRPQYYLRNLTTRQLVSISIADRSEFPRVIVTTEEQTTHDAQNISLDDVLVMQTRWSAAMAQNVGPWVGHSFDILSIEAHRADESSVAGWQDVTNSVLSKARRECVNNRGSLVETIKTDLVVVADAFVEDKDGNRVGKLTDGDPKRLVGRSVDKDGDVIDKRGNVVGHAELL